MGTDEIKLIVYTTVQMSNYFKSITNGQRSTPWFAGPNAPTVWRAHIGLHMPNAWYTDDAIFFGGGFETDDVIAHEWGHGFTEYSNGLKYMHEPGALNEAFSDIWGEAIDLENEVIVADPSKVDDRSTTQSCVASQNWSPYLPATDTSHRFIMGEEIITEGHEGGLRDMYFPECFGNPGSMSSPFYRCTPDLYTLWEHYPWGPNNYWVHVHSGIPDRVFAMLWNGAVIPRPRQVDLTINKVGKDKLHRLFYETSLLMVYETGFQDFATLLSDTCTNLVRTSATLYHADLTNGESTQSSEVMTAQDCVNVNNALMVTQMNEANNHCPSYPNAAPLDDDNADVLCKVVDHWNPTFSDGNGLPTIGWNCGRNRRPNIDPCSKFGSWEGVFCGEEVDDDDGERKSKVIGINLFNNILGMDATSKWDGIPEEIFDFEKLQFLSLLGNSIPMKLDEDLDELEDLRFLDLRGNAIRGEIPDLSDLKKLKALLLGSPKSVQDPNFQWTITKLPESLCYLYQYHALQVVDLTNVNMQLSCVPQCIFDHGDNDDRDNDDRDEDDRDEDDRDNDDRDEDDRFDDDDRRASPNLVAGMIAIPALLAAAFAGAWGRDYFRSTSSSQENVATTTN